MASLTDSLEKKAAKIRERVREGKSRSEPLSSLEKEIGFVLDQLDGLRKAHEQHLTEIAGTKLRIYSEFKFHPYASKPFRDRLEDKMAELDEERRKLLTRHEKQVSEMRDRLFTLLNRHSILSRDDRSGKAP